MIVVTTVACNIVKRLRAVCLLGTHQQTLGLQMFHDTASHVARLLLLPNICSPSPKRRRDPILDLVRSRFVVVVVEQRGDLARSL